ncbi:MAG: D-alanine--D-alanine ligase [Alphaproteobacteria bacterium]|nr:D-alanine--D-alanine ligase [Alphaproteobacteria bacterium]MDD9919635.1 D-alanine--D-alanine ligase [Alphaproteobacteria bacterium]
MQSIKKVAILMGGQGPEAEISRLSAEGIGNALKQLNISYFFVELDDTWVELLEAGQPDFVYIALHGSPGEDGTIQGFLENMDLPYQGCGVSASALAIDKPKTKECLESIGVGVADGIVLSGEGLNVASNWVDFFHNKNRKIVVKPSACGSSVGVHIIQDVNEIPKAIADAAQYSPFVMLEEYISGQELVVVVLNGQAQGVMEIVPHKGAFYDYASKYQDGGSTHTYPANISIEVEKRCLLWAEKTCDVTGCSGAVRVDFRYDARADKLIVMEINTLPGFTKVSLLPELMGHLGVSFPELVTWTIQDGLNQYRERKSICKAA